MFSTWWFLEMGHSSKDPYPPPQRKLTIPPLWTSYKNLIHSLDNSPPLPRQQKFSLWVGYGSFLEWPNLTQVIKHQMNMCKIDHQAFSNVKVLSETCLFSTYGNGIFVLQILFFSGKRPFGVSLLYMGWDKHYGFQLYQSDPSGNFSGWKATCIGNNSVVCWVYLLSCSELFSSEF